MSSLIDLLQNDGISLRRQANTHGGEYSGPCPFCGGKDRFRVWPEKDRYWCRQCGKSGDAIQYLRDTKGLSYREACQELKVIPNETTHRSDVNGRLWEPRQPKPPKSTWQEKAIAFLAQSQKWLERKTNHRQWLYGRCLSEETIKKACLGWNPSGDFIKREEWGLPLEINGKTGKPKKLWLPEGLVIPHVVDGHVNRLRIRRPRQDQYGRYILIPGSDTRAITWGTERTSFVIVESELDGLLINQEAGNLVGVVALGSAQTRPDIETHNILEQSELILVALDSDEAGAKAAWQWWLKHYPKAKRWPVIGGKDPSEAMQNGLNIRTWIEAGLMPDRDKAKDIKAQPAHDSGLSQGKVGQKQTSITSNLPEKTNPENPGRKCGQCVHLVPFPMQRPKWDSPQSFRKCKILGLGRFPMQTGCKDIEQDVNGSV
jgi:hypothetical protein